MRWAAVSLLATEKNYRKIQGYEDLWILKVALGRTAASKKKLAQYVQRKPSPLSTRLGTYSSFSARFHRLWYQLARF